MKFNYIFTFIYSLIGFYTVVFSQPLNNSFEEWNSTDPVNWSSSDEFGGVNGIIQSSDAYDGLFSVRLEVLTFAGFPYPAWLQSIDDNGNYHSISSRYEILNGWYKFIPLGNDQLYITVTMLDSNSSIVGGGLLEIQNPVSNWTEFVLPISYMQGSPESVQILITISVIDSSAQTNPGSYALIDHLSFSNLTSVSQPNLIPANFSLSQNYPNPFNASTVIRYQIPDAGYVRLSVINVLGIEVERLVDKYQETGGYEVTFNNDDIASGIYVLALQYEESLVTKKMVILK